MATITVTNKTFSGPSSVTQSFSKNQHGSFSGKDRVPILNASHPSSCGLNDSRPPSSARVFDVAPLNIVNRRRRIIVTTLLVLANLIQNISNCVTIVGGLKISQTFGVTGAHATWTAAAYPLTQGTFVLMSGRLGAILGHKNMLVLGGTWFTVLTLVNGFIPNFLGFCAVRALSGIGGALILPNCVAMIGITNPPGRTRNISFGLVGASAPIGGYIGGILIGLFDEYSQIKWCFPVLAGASAAVFFPLWILTGKEVPLDSHGRIDYVGSFLGTSALIIFNFVWNQAPAAGWAEPYEYSLLLVSLLFFLLFVLWERRTPHPILPMNIFKAPSFGPLLIVVALNFMTLGTVLWYMLLWQQNLRHWTILETALGWSPFFICSTLGTVLAAWLVSRIGAQWIVAIGTLSAAASAIILATMPKEQNYWIQIFPATVLMSLCPDLTYTAAQIIASNAVKREQQGVAGSLIGTLNFYGVSLGLGFASTVQHQVQHDRGSVVLGYRAACYFGFGLAMIALLLDLIFVRMVKEDREGWGEGEGDEERQDARVATAASIGGADVQLREINCAVTV